MKLDEAIKNIENENFNMRINARLFFNDNLVQEEVLGEINLAKNKRLERNSLIFKRVFTDNETVFVIENTGGKTSIINGNVAKTFARKTCMKKAVSFSFKNDEFKKEVMEMI